MAGKVCLECAASNRFKWQPCPQHSPAISPEDCKHDNTSHVLHANAASHCNATTCHACNLYTDDCITCTSCRSGLDEGRAESYYPQPLCDDCNLDRAIALNVV